MLYQACTTPNTVFSSSLNLIKAYLTPATYVQSKLVASTYKES